MKYNRKTIIALFIMLFVLLVLLCNSLQAQSPVPYGGGSTVTMQKVETFRPTLWDVADGMDIADSYCVYKETSKIGSRTYLIGFNEDGTENMRMVIEEVLMSSDNQFCFVYQNGREIRLRNPLF